jgi:sugar phosphate permease
MTTNTLGRLSRVAEYDVFVLTAGIWFLAKLLRYAVSALFSVFRAEFEVSNALLGMAFTTMMADYMLSQFPGGALADRLGGGRIIVVGGITAATGALVVGTVTRFSTLVGR